MKWNQPSKKEVTPARAEDITFVKPSHSDIKGTNEIKLYKRHQFDPRQLDQRTLQMESVTKLLSEVKKSVPNCGLQQFWQTNSAVSHHIQGRFSGLWMHIFVLYIQIKITVNSTENTIISNKGMRTAAVIAPVHELVDFVTTNC